MAEIHFDNSKTDNDLFDPPQHGFRFELTSRKYSISKPTPKQHFHNALILTAVLLPSKQNHPKNRSADLEVAFVPKAVRTRNPYDRNLT
jgi:hypothetical protein